MQIRPATMVDSEGIAKLVSDLGYETSSTQMVKRLETIFDDDDYRTVVALDESRIVGFVGSRLGPLYESDGQYGQIMALAVASGYRRRGIGRMLLQAAESALIARGVRILTVVSGDHRADAHAFYEAVGYGDTGRRFKKTLSE